MEKDLERLEKEKLELEIKQLKNQFWKKTVIIITILLPFAVAGINWIVNKRYIDLDLEVKKRENLIAFDELRKSNLKLEEKEDSLNLIITDKLLLIKQRNDSLSSLSTELNKYSVQLSNFNLSLENKQTELNETQERVNFKNSELKLAEQAFDTRKVILQKGIDSLNFAEQAFEIRKVIFQKGMDSLNLAFKTAEKSLLKLTLRNKIEDELRRITFLIKESENEHISFYLNDLKHIDSLLTEIKLNSYLYDGPKGNSSWQLFNPTPKEVITIIKDMEEELKKLITSWEVASKNRKRKMVKRLKGWPDTPLGSPNWWNQEIDRLSFPLKE